MTERVFEIVLKTSRELTSVTITADRTTIKIPDHHSEELRERIASFVKGIEGEVRAKFPQSMRGSFNHEFLQLDLRNNSRTETISFPTGGLK